MTDASTLSSAQLQMASQLLESLSQPLAICDEGGALLCLNQNARRVLGLGDQPPSHILLHISSRDTFSSRQRLGHLREGTTEFFLADVQVTGAATQFVSVSFVPMDFGGFRVQFVEERSQPPAVEVLAALGEATQHMALLEDVPSMLALFVSCLTNVLEHVACRLELHHHTQHEHVEVGYPIATRRERVSHIAYPNEPEVPRNEMLYKESRWGYRFVFEQEDTLCLYLQLETTSAWGLSSNALEAAEVFIHTCGLMIRRQHVQGEQVPSLDMLTPMLNQIGAIFIWCDARRRIKTCNTSFEQLVQREVNALIGDDVLLFFAPEQRDQLRASLADISDTSSTHSVNIITAHGAQPYDIHINRTASDAMARDILIIGQPISTHASTDANEQAPYAIAQLATGVAHELKNPMTSIMNYAEFLLKKYPKDVFDARDRDRLRRIIEGVERMDQYIKDLVLLARSPDAADTETFDIHAVISQALMMCDHVIHQHQIRLAQHLHDDPLMLRGNAHQMVQVFVNLFANAAHAMTDHGETLTITTTQAFGHEMMTVTIEDNGCGMSDETRQRLFEPFYTTKKATGGSGLGMVLVDTIVKQHHGRIDVLSAEGQGTCFTLTLPVAVDA